MDGYAVEGNKQGEQVMYYVAWNGERWSAPFRPCDLVECPTGGLLDRDGFSITWDQDGYRGENWIALERWTDEKAARIEGLL